MIMKKFLMTILFNLLLLSAFAQGLDIKGVITDESGNSLPGVTIKVKGSNVGVVSNSDGRYTINVPSANAILVFSSVGFNNQEIDIGGRTTVNVQLIEQNQSLEDVVVVGYGTQKKASVVGAISNVDVSDLRRAAPSNLSNALGGRVPGLITRMGDGAIGGATNRYSNGTLDDGQIYIRGKATLNSQGALVLIDGVEGSMSRINPEDIDQISVLKDASATAVYGVRGANGVILVTTRRGTVGKPRISVTSQFRRLKPLDYPEFLGSYDYAMLFNEARRNFGEPEMYSEADLEHYRTGDSPYTHPNVNWRDELTNDHYGEQQYVANITGGTEKVRYYIGGEHNRAGGIFVGSKEKNTNYFYRRYNLRSNLDFAITKSTELSVSVNGRLNDLNNQATPESSGQRNTGGAWNYITVRRPNEYSLLNPNGSYTYGSGPTWNVLVDLMDGSTIRRLSNTLESNFALNQKLDFLVEGLSFRGLYAMSFASGSYKQLNRQPASYSYDPVNDTYTLQEAEMLPNYSGIATSGNFLDFGRTQQVEAALNYNTTVGEDHAITAMAVALRSNYESGGSQPRYYQGISGRVTYAFRGKYLAESNLGYNGSDAFNKDKRFKLFPSAAIGWVASEESAIKDNLKFIDFLKLRASYGEVGNDKLGSGFQYFYQYLFQAPTAPGTSNNVNGYYSLGEGTGTSQIGLTEGTLGNDLVTWETARKTDIGLELRLFKNRISFTGDVFFEQRDDILWRREDMPLLSGISGKLPPLNLGKVENKGLELSLGYKEQFGDFNLDVQGNYTFVRNKVIYKGEAKKEYPWLYSTGHPLNTELLYIWTGEFYSAEDLANPEVPRPAGKIIPGDLVFEDLNGDGEITSDDMAYTGFNETPEIMVGLNLNLGFKNFYLSTNWYGATNVAYRVGGNFRNEFGNNVQAYQKEGRWVYDPSRGLDSRETATYPALVVGGSTTVKMSSTFNKLNSEYIRLRAAELGYDFPESLTQKFRVSRFRVFVSGSNLLTFSPMKKFKIDPEYIGSQNPDISGTAGNTNGAYAPQNKFYAFGFNLTF